MNILTESIADKIVAGSYKDSAAEEKRTANWMRRGSLGCMLVIAWVLIYALYESLHTEFNWEKSVFRIAIGLLLSVPAAYLARESAKHREQQYQHQQTFLDLKAISPFMASLPNEEQHKIKSALASKIFSGRDFSKVSADPYPLNMQEIFVELVKKLEIPKTETKADSKAESSK